jgi:hypothetical protein
MGYTGHPQLCLWSNIFNDRFVHILFGDDQKIYKRMKPIISHGGNEENRIAIGFVIYCWKKSYLAHRFLSDLILVFGFLILRIKSLSLFFFFLADFTLNDMTLILGVE